MPVFFNALCNEKIRELEMMIVEMDQQIERGIINNVTREIAEGTGLVGLDDIRKAICNLKKYLAEMENCDSMI